MSDRVKIKLAQGITIDEFQDLADKMMEAHCEHCRHFVRIVDTMELI